MRIVIISMGSENISEIVQGIISLLPILSILISGIIAYDIYWSDGNIEIFIPDEVNLDKSLVLTVHSTFSNDGAPPTSFIIKDVKAKAWIHRENKPVEEVQFKWLYTDNFMSKIEHERLYPNQIQENAVDYLVYERRKAPFTVQGKTTVSKLLRFYPQNNINNLSEPFNITIKIIATTMDNRTFISQEKEYIVDESKFKSIIETGLSWSISSKDSQIE